MNRDREIAQLGDRVRELADLKATRGWDELGRVYQERREAWVKGLAATLLAGDGLADQRDIDYHRGYFAAWRDLLAHPDKAEKRFEKALRDDERNA